MFSLAVANKTGRLASRLELGLDVAAFLFLPTLVLVPRGIALLTPIAAALAVGMIFPARMAASRTLHLPAILLGALLVWAAVSASWSVIPAHSLVISARLSGLFAAGLALTMAAQILESPRRLLSYFYCGLAVALILAVVQFTTNGLLTRPFMTRGFFAPQLNQSADTLAILVFPASATLLYRGRPLLMILLATAAAVVICGHVGTAAKTALGAGVLLTALLYLSPRNIARAAAIVSALIIVTAPLTFTRAARIDAVIDMAEEIKFSAWHRLMIWSFTGDRIAERPLSGWGLDASRAIPGGKEPMYEGRVWLPLHPHNAALQVWLELGAPGAMLFAIIVAWLWLCLAAASWPRLFTAAAGASLGTALVAAIGAYGIWQEWWIGTLSFSLFLILVMARRLCGDERCLART
jgi:O-antigen ligase